MREACCSVLLVDAALAFAPDQFFFDAAKVVLFCRHTKCESFRQTSEEEISEKSNEMSICLSGNSYRFL